MRDYRQNEILQSMKVQDLCCTYNDWVQCWRTSDSVYHQLERDSQGQWPYLSMEGSQLRTELSAPSSMLKQLKKFPAYLLGVSNQMICKLLERGIGSLPLMNWDTLSNVRIIQEVEIVLQNAPYSQKDQIASTERESMCMCLTDFRVLMSFKETNASVSACGRGLFRSSLTNTRENATNWIPVRSDQYYHSWSSSERTLHCLDPHEYSSEQRKHTTPDRIHGPHRGGVCEPGRTQAMQEWPVVNGKSQWSFDCVEETLHNSRHQHADPCGSIRLRNGPQGVRCVTFL